VRAAFPFVCGIPVTVQGDFFIEAVS